MNSLYEKTKNSTSKFRGLGYSVTEMWEHDFAREKKENSSLRDFLNIHKIEDRLNPRDAFFGGRTNAVKLFYEGTAKYVDFTSLYPWVCFHIISLLFFIICFLNKNIFTVLWYLQVNKYCRYPVGHPRIITSNFEDIEQYFGVIKCEILPPRDLYFPVLPVRCNGKLLFPLCITCATDKLKKCDHSEDQRVFVGTWVTEEVKLAVKQGYKIVSFIIYYYYLC